MLLKYAFKSTKVMGQLGAAGVIALAGIGLLFSTVSRWRYDTALREAIFAANSGQGDPRAALDDAVGMRPDDPFPTLLRGQWLLERGELTLANAADPAADPGKAPAASGDVAKGAAKQLAQAVKDYDSAVKKLKDWPGASESYQAIAAAGSAAARLALADADPSQRAELIEQATKALEQAPSSDDPDFLGVRAGLQIARGDTAAAMKTCAELGGKLGQASRLAVASYHWNHGLLEILARDPECAFELERAALYRHSSESGRLLGLAIRVAAADPTVPVKSPEALSARLVQLRRILAYKTRSRQGVTVSRFGMDPGDEGRTWNAIGIGHTRVPEADKALEAFQLATNSSSKDPIYRQNRAVAFRVKAEHPAADEKDLKAWERENYDHYAAGLESAASVLAGKPDREPQAIALLMTASTIRWKIFEVPDATMPPIDTARGTFHLGEAEYFRWIGALQDWGKRLDYAVPSYKKAIALHHRDSSKMESRVDEFERDKKGR